MAFQLRTEVTEPPKPAKLEALHLLYVPLHRSRSTARIQDGNITKRTQQKFQLPV